MTRCAICLAHHSNTTVCDDCADRVARDIDSDPEGVGNGVAETLRAVLCLEDIDAAGTEAVLENQRLRTENSALKQRLYYLKQLLDEGEEPHG
jgi:hypothetical protein